MRVRFNLVLRGILACLLVTAALGVTRPVDSVSDTVTNTDPNLADVDDMLNGKWEIAPVDDLVLANPIFSNGTFSVRNFPLYTDSNKVSSQGVTQTVTSQQACPPNGGFPQQTLLGRLFNLKNDVSITVTVSSSCQVVVYVTDPVSGAQTSLSLNGFTAGRVRGVVADFNSDGYDDVFVVVEGYAAILTARDVDDQTQGLENAAWTQSAPTAQPISEPAVGDFNNDGIPEVAWVAGQAGGYDASGGGTETVYFASVCLMPNAACTGGHANVHIDSQTISLGTTTVSKEFAQFCEGTAALAAGHFFSDEAGGDQLFIALTTTVKEGTSPCHEPEPECVVVCGVNLYSYGFDGGLTPNKAQELDSVVEGLQFAQVFAAAGQLDWFGDGDQAVLATSTLEVIDDPRGDRYEANVNVSTVTFDSNGDMTLLSTNGTDGSTAVYWGLAVGRFTTDTSTTNAYSPSIAVFRANASDAFKSTSSSPRIDIFTLKDPSNGDFTPLCCNTFDVSNWQEMTSLQGLSTNMLQAGDLQGRSMRLGPPLVVRVTDHWQPKVLLGVPPMHVDYVQIAGATSPAVVNFSAIPSTFNSQYQTSQTNTNQSSSTNTTK
jgi:VCBS repeat protein